MKKEDFLRGLFGSMEKLPAPYKSFKTRKKVPPTYTKHHDGEYATMIPDYIQTIRDALAGENATTAVVKLADGSYASETQAKAAAVRGGEYTVITRLLTNGEASGVIVMQDGTSAPMPEQSGLLLPVLLAAQINKDDSVVNQSFVKLRGASDTGFLEDEFRILCDDLYYSVKTGAQPLFIQSDALPVAEIQALSGKVLWGKPRMLGNPNTGDFDTGSTISAMTLAKASELPWVQDFRKKYPTKKQDRSLIPTMPEDMVIPPEILEIARKFALTIGDNIAYNNVMLRGTTGSGKSTGTQLLGALLQRPVVTVNCNNDVGTEDLLTQFAPNTSEAPSTGLPTPQEMALDFSKAWYKLTGQKKPAEMVDPIEMIRLYGERCRGADNNQFRLIKSFLVKALINGWICEIAEPSRIRQPGALVGLNNLSNAGAAIPMKDGTTMTRSPLAMVLYTDNVNLLSTKQIDESVLSRTMVYDMDVPDKATILARVRYNASCSALPNAGEYLTTDLLNVMYDVWDGVRKFTKENGICADAIGQRELEQWAKGYLISEGHKSADLLRECRRAVVSKTTTDPDDQQRIMDSVVDPLLSKF